MILTEIRIFEEDHEIILDEGVPKSREDYLYKTQKQRHREDHVGRDWRDLSSSHGGPMIAINYQKLEEVGKDSSLEGSTECDPTNTLILGSWPLEL